MEVGTLKNLVKQAKTVCCTTKLKHQKLEHLKAIFTEINEYPNKIVNKTVSQDFHQTQRLQNTVIRNGDTRKVQLILPYNQKQGDKLLSKTKKNLTKSPPPEMKTAVTYQDNT